MDEYRIQYMGRWIPRICNRCDHRRFLAGGPNGVVMDRMAKASPSCSWAASSRTRPAIPPAARYVLPMMIPSLLCSVLVSPQPHVNEADAAPAPIPAQETSADTFMAAMEGAGLIKELRQIAATGQPVTLLRPTDSAFSTLTPEVMTSLFDADNRRPLRELLLRHVLAGSGTTVEYLDQGFAPTRSGDKVTASIQGGGVRFGDATVLAGPRATDDPGEGFLVYEIDSVIGFDPGAFQRSPAQRVAADSLEASASLPQPAAVAILSLGLRAVLELEPENALAETAVSQSQDQRTPAALRAALEAIRDGLSAPTMSDDSLPLITFARGTDEPGWFTLNDDVMGGISTSRFDYGDGGIGIFEGALSLENNGGFASIRSNQRDYELDDYTGLRIRVRGDGREYGLNAMAGDDRGRVGSWRKRFMTVKGEWQTIDVPFSEMVLNIRGRQFPNVGPPRKGQIRSFSIIIGDKNINPFRLEIDSISAYK